MESLEVAPEIGQIRFREFDLFINEFSFVFFFLLPESQTLDL